MRLKKMTATVHFFITCFIPVDGDKNPLNLRIFRHDICCSENRREDDERK